MIQIISDAAFATPRSKSSAESHAHKVNCRCEPRQLSVLQSNNCIVSPIHYVAWREKTGLDRFHWPGKLSPMKKAQGCGCRDLMLTLYTTTAQDKLLPPLSGFTNIPCGFEPLMYDSGTQAVLLCEVCAVKNGYIAKPLVMSASVA